MKKYRGFTLIETLIYIGLIGIVLVGFVNFVFSISSARNKAYVAQEVQANARMALNTISQKIKSASDVNLGSTVFNTDPGALSLTINGESVVIGLNQDDGNLQIIVGSSDPLFITSNEVKVTNLIFSNFTSGSNKENIKISITVSYKNQDSREFAYEQTIETAVSLRQ